MSTRVQTNGFFPSNSPAWPKVAGSSIRLAGSSKVRTLIVGSFMARCGPESVDGVAAAGEADIHRARIAGPTVRIGLLLLGVQLLLLLVAVAAKDPEQADRRRHAVLRHRRQRAGIEAGLLRRPLAALDLVLLLHRRGLAMGRVDELLR